MTEIKLKNNIPILNKALQKAWGESLQKFGLVAEIKITEKILSNIPPPNAPSTIKNKGSSQTLIDTGALLGNITSELRDGGKSVVVGIIGNSVVAVRGYVNEFGTDTIPERSFLRSVFNSQDDKTEMIGAVKKEIKQAISNSTIK